MRSFHPTHDLAPLLSRLGHPPLPRVQLRQAGVEVCSPASPGANTGTVVVLTSPDAQRTMLSYLGTPAEVAVDASLEAAIARSRVLVVEGYLWWVGARAGCGAGARRRGVQGSPLPTPLPDFRQRPSCTLLRSWTTGGRPSRLRATCRLPCRAAGSCPTRRAPFAGPSPLRGATAAWWR